MDLGKRLKEARERADLSQEALARRADVSTVAVSQIEQGRTKEPHYLTLHRLSKVLGVSPHWLYTGEELEQPVLAGKAEAPTDTGRDPAFYDQEERLLRYLRVLQLFATDMHEVWAAKVERDDFGADEFEHAAATLLMLDTAHAHGVGTDLLAALLNHELVLPEAEREAFNSAKASIDDWHRTMWRAYYTLRERGAENVVRLDRFREAFEAWDRGHHGYRAAGA